MTLVAKARGKEKFREAEAPRLTEQEKVLPADCYSQRRRQGLPVGYQFRECDSIEYGAGKDMSADFGTFFNEADAQFAPVFESQLSHADGCGKSGRTTTDNHDVVVH
jgi:hypothetical protein